MVEKNLKILPKFSDNTSFLYIDKGIIERRDSAVVVYVGDSEIPLPVATINTVMLGPGTRVTHGAMVVLAEAGASVLWVGEDLQKLYASGMGRSRSSENLLKQVEAYSSHQKRLTTIRSLYEMRFSEELEPALTLQQIRGKEGARVRDSYFELAKKFGVDWRGRSYQRASWTSADPPNRALSSGASCLYGVCHAAIVSMGFSAGIGFIHTGKQLSFVYDVADLYKTELLIPAAFEAVATHTSGYETATRKLLREKMKELKLLDRIVSDLTGLFNSPRSGEQTFDEIDAPASLFDDKSGPVSGGENYARDDP